MTDAIIATAHTSRKQKTQTSPDNCVSLSLSVAVTQPVLGNCNEMSLGDHEAENCQGQIQYSLLQAILPTVPFGSVVFSTDVQFVGASQVLQTVDTSCNWSFLNMNLFVICMLRCINFSFLGMHYAKKILISNRSEKVNNFLKGTKESGYKAEKRTEYPGPLIPLQ